MGGCLSQIFGSQHSSYYDKQSSSSGNYPTLTSDPAYKIAKENKVMNFGYKNGFGTTYRVGKELGRGQFGITYMCEHIESGHKFAVKTVKKKSLTSIDSIEDTKREVAILKRLSGHENIVELEGVYEDESYIHIVMELCAGGELFDKIIAKGHYAEKDASILVQQMLNVVAECHLNGVIHRDLKPENFLFKDQSDQSPIKAIDFGLSEFFDPRTIFKDVVGSAYYVAPEVLKRNYGPPADIWSIGVIMYILLSGQPPFWGPTESAIFNEILRAKLNLSQSPWPHISASAKDILKRMLTVDPKARITAAQALSCPWVKGEGTSEIPLDISVINNMKEFASFGKMKKLAIKKLAQTFSDEEIRDLKDQFRSIDRDGSGTITYQELMDSVRHMKTNEAGVQVIPDDEVTSILRGMDSDGNGEIDQTEFVAAALHLTQLQRRDREQWNRRTQQAFDSLDRDKDGFIDADELRGEFGDSEHLEDILNEADKDGNGKIDYEEFCILLRTKSATKRRR